MMKNLANLDIRIVCRPAKTYSQQSTNSQSSGKKENTHAAYCSGDSKQNCNLINSIT